MNRPQLGVWVLHTPDGPVSQRSRQVVSKHQGDAGRHVGKQTAGKAEQMDLHTARERIVDMHCADKAGGHVGTHSRKIK